MKANEKKCKTKDCDYMANSKGLCGKCYNTQYIRIKREERVMAKAKERHN